MSKVDFCVSWKAYKEDEAIEFLENLRQVYYTPQLYRPDRYANDLDYGWMRPEHEEVFDMKTELYDKILQEFSDKFIKDSCKIYYNGMSECGIQGSFIAPILTMPSKCNKFNIHFHEYIGSFRTSIEVEEIDHRTYFFKNRCEALLERLVLIADLENRVMKLERQIKSSPDYDERYIRCELYDWWWRDERQPEWHRQMERRREYERHKRISPWLYEPDPISCREAYEIREARARIKLEREASQDYYARKYRD